MKQRQFLDVVDDGVAQERFREAARHLEARSEVVSLGAALGRVLFADLAAPVDVPGFDRSNMDGFAVRAADTYGADELNPRRLTLAGAPLAAGDRPRGTTLAPGTARSVATGAVLPRGADAVLMVEHTAPAVDAADAIDVQRSVVPGDNLTGAGTDVGRGEIVLRRHQVLGSRETAVAAAVGAATLPVFARPRVAVLSTGDEVRPPGAALEVGEVFDSNSRIICDAVRELGGEARFLGIFRDDAGELTAALVGALEGVDRPDLVILSGGTSKGAGDLNGEVLRSLVGRWDVSPGIVLHGVALKPGKPLCLALLAARPVVVLPGFPTSAIFTFHEFVAPILRRLAGRAAAARPTVRARVPLRIRSAVGRTEFVLVDLVPGGEYPGAYPLGAGSGSVSTFSFADGYVRIDRHTEYLEEGELVDVHPLGERVRDAELTAIGSHCVGLDLLLGRLAERGFATKSIPVGSQGGLAALERGEGDVAGCHLLDAETGVYNVPFLSDALTALGGWGRRQGIVFRRGDARFVGRDLAGLAQAIAGPDVRMVSRNRGSGTRVLIDRFLESAGGLRPDGFHTQARSHHAVAAAVAQGRADWGLTLDVLARSHELEFVFVQEERFDLIARRDRLDRPAVAELRRQLADPEVRTGLARLELVPDPSADPGAARSS